MIIDFKTVTEEEYIKFKSQYYLKPGIPEIELELQELQKRLLINRDFSALPEIKEKASIYCKSLLLKQLTKKEYIDPAEVDSMAEQAALNFIKRFFRNDKPIIGASFAGLLEFKVREVLSDYHSQRGLESKVSLDVLYGSSNEDEGVSFESLVSYQNYLQEKNERDFDSSLDATMEKLEAILDQLALVKKPSISSTDLQTDFLIYLIYLVILKSGLTTKDERPLSTLSNQALKLLDFEEDGIDYSILETALMDTF